MQLHSTAKRPRPLPARRPAYSHFSQSAKFDCNWYLIPVQPTMLWEKEQMLSPKQHGCSLSPARIPSFGSVRKLKTRCETYVLRTGIPIQSGLSIKCGFNVNRGLTDAYVSGLCNQTRHLNYAGYSPYTYALPPSSPPIHS